MEEISLRGQEILDMLRLVSIATDKKGESTLDRLGLNGTIYNITLNLATLAQCEFEVLQDIDLRGKKVQLIRIKETGFLHIVGCNINGLISPSLNNQQIKFTDYIGIGHTHSPCLIFQTNDGKRYNLYLNGDMEQKVY